MFESCRGRHNDQRPFGGACMVERSRRPAAGVYDNARWDVQLHLRRDGPFTAGEAKTVLERLDPQAWSVNEIWLPGDESRVDLTRISSSRKIFALSLATTDRAQAASLHLSEYCLAFQMLDPDLKRSNRLERLVDPLFSHPDVLSVAGCDVTALAYDQVFVRAGYHYEVGGRPGVRPVSGYCTVNWLSEDQARLIDLEKLDESGFFINEIPDGFVKIKTPSYPFFTDLELDQLHETLRPVRVRRHAAVPSNTSDKERSQFSRFDRELLIEKRRDEHGRYDFALTIEALPDSHPDRRYWKELESIDQRDKRLGIEHEGLPAEWE